jgi:hypothetical protein
MLTFATYAVNGGGARAREKHMSWWGARSYEFTQQRYEVGCGKFMEFEKEETGLINIMYNIQDHWVFGFCPLSGILKKLKLKTQHFGNWICFRPQVRGRNPL